MTTGALRHTRADRVHRLTLTRPDAGNAVDQNLADAFATSVSDVLQEREPCIVVLDSTGPQFCSGGDVHAIATAPDPAAALHRLAATMHDALAALRSSPHVVVCAVQGAAAGAGLALVLNADLVVAARHAVFLSAYAGVGLTPDCGVSYLLPRVVGPRRAAELALTGRVLTAEEALEWGLVNTVVAPDELGRTLDTLVTRLTDGAAWAQSRTMALLRREETDFRSHLDAELEGLDQQISLPDTSARMNAFLARSREKRR